MKKILINDLLQLSETEIKNTKIKLNIPDGVTNPLDEYKKDPEKVNTGWLLWHKKSRYFHEGQTAICLLNIGGDKWLLTTIKK